MKKLIIAGLFLMGLHSIQAQKNIPLYSGKAPGTENWKQKEAQTYSDLFKTEVVYNVAQPSILVFEADKAKASGTVIIIAPGGGFQSLSIKREGIDLAKKLADEGITAVVLKYRLLETKSNDPAREMMENIKDRKAFDSKTAPIKIMAGDDIKTAVTYVRSHAKELNIQPDKLGVIGFSAGASVILESVLHSKDASTVPNFAASIYGGPNEDVLASKIPAAIPMFICAASDDQLKLAPKSIQLYNKWLEAGQPVELHMYEKGGHGFGMGVQNLPVDHWIEQYTNWLKSHKYL
ncbi:acetyl esterase/lipase [Chryseobacterium sp. H1D6B]|uniref:alpha/beta hydrolase n=1 Tax=Chryseobacterium sp. H1D6B TaxID=2940588 RepID=UPI0015CCEE94|nr:alpha/beta hydrolase [Chryseobacterium sp. H1D6B]MDH6253798.1 acetyl esterase/lipase [Chryseobacterium sp. H1D6B]